MSTVISWPEITLRLALTLAAGFLLGLNRETQGRPAGLRTTTLICLAASLSMIQVNLLLGMTGKTPASFAVMDLMRLPLGILSGMGFIGAGAILKKGSLVSGVTTAATLWFSTVMGLCLGGGQLVLGVIACALGCSILWGLKAIEARMNEQHEGVLTLTVEGSSFPQAEVVRRISATKAKVTNWMDVVIEAPTEAHSCQICWKANKETAPPPFLKALADIPKLKRLDWKPTVQSS